MDEEDGQCSTCNDTVLGEDLCEMTPFYRAFNNDHHTKENNFSSYFIHENELANTPKDQNTSSYIDDDVGDEGQREETPKENKVDEIVDSVIEEFASPEKEKRLNFALYSTGALIMKTNVESKGAENVLNYDVDKYYLTPCSAKKFFVISLSEDVLVEDFILANYERYSSFFSDFKVSGATSYPVKDPSEWIFLGKFHAEKIFGEQPFVIKPAERRLVRYLKFEFLDFYGNEFYCTLSGVKIFGKTQLGMLEQTNGNDKVYFKDALKTSEKQNDDFLNKHSIADAKLNGEQEIYLETKRKIIFHVHEFGILPGNFTGHGDHLQAAGSRFSQGVLNLTNIEVELVGFGNSTQLNISLILDQLLPFNARMLSPNASLNGAKNFTVGDILANIAPVKNITVEDKVVHLDIQLVKTDIPWQQGITLSQNICFPCIQISNFSSYFDLVVDGLQTSQDRSLWFLMLPVGFKGSFGCMSVASPMKSKLKPSLICDLLDISNGQTTTLMTTLTYLDAFWYHNPKADHQINQPLVNAPKAAPVHEAELTAQIATGQVDDAIIKVKLEKLSNDLRSMKDDIRALKSKKSELQLNQTLLSNHIREVYNTISVDISSLEQTFEAQEARIEAAIISLTSYNNKFADEFQIMNESLGSYMEQNEILSYKYESVVSANKILIICNVCILLLFSCFIIRR